MYQLCAYGHKYLRDKPEKKLMLIYPETDTFFEPLPIFTYESGFELEVVPFDIDTGQLIQHPHSANTP
ncbi:MAG: 5-methylcytosine-specific restriction endonuclease McrBC regulatory subunit McrC [Candidatus Azotimanducaceae bacterium]|jgi:5-methylcytosine-specific restriction endonuclease McrBC regulatory subunit McrC